MAETLTPQLLGELETRWRQMRAPIAAGLGPGLDDREIERLTAGFPRPLPSEPRTWWGWRTITPIDVPWNTAMTGAPWRFTALEAAVAEARRERLEDSAYDATLWRPSWLPVARDLGGNYLVVDCDVASGEPCPIHFVDSEYSPDIGEVVAPSLGTVVRWWLEAIDDGATAYDAEAGEWWYDEDPLRPEHRASGVV